MPTRWTQDQVRHFALSFPEAHLGARWGHSDLRVRNKIFAALPTNPASVILKSTPLAVDMLVRADSDTFQTVWNGWWVGVALNCVEPNELRDLVVDAYSLVAPKPLSSALRFHLPVT